MNRILVVDDCEFVGQAIAANFNSNDVIVEFAATIDTARRMIESHQVVLVIVDAILRNDHGEVENGLDFVSELHQQGMPALLVSGHNRPEYASSGAFLAKPFDGALLAETCLDLLESAGQADRCPQLLERLREFVRDD